MKKLISLIFAFILVTNLAYARPVTMTAAHKTAESFFSQNSNQALNSVTLTYTETALNGAPVFYVFNLNVNDGFVIVAADDAALPVISYTPQGQFNVPAPKYNGEVIEKWESEKWAAKYYEPRN